MFNVNEGFKDLPVVVPCGRCIGCRIDRSRAWSVRIMHDVEQEIFSCFISLTYTDENIPKGGTLVKSDLQKFWKRLRKRLSKDEPEVKFRYYQCGEYGETTKRPHYHAIIIGWRPNDLQYYKKEGGNRLFTSDTLTSVWGFGHVVVGQVSLESAQYVANYCTDKITGEKADNHYRGRLPEFSTCSRGIGREWIDKNKSDVIRAGGRIILPDGKNTKVPRYYEKVWEGADVDDFINYKGIKSKNGKLYADDNTPDRLLVKEQIVTHNLNKIRRDYA